MDAEMRSRKVANLRILSSTFHGVSRTVFIDLCHISESDNGRIADLMMEGIRKVLRHGKLTPPNMPKSLHSFVSPFP